jgi:hypothetical protein
LTRIATMVWFLYMSNVTPERKESVIKSLALLGLFGLIILIAWLSVQIVSVLPKAVTSLASLADSVYSYDPKSAGTVKLTETPKNLTTGVPSTIRWDKPFSTGTYSFSYDCGKDVFLEIKSPESEFAGLECNKKYNLGNVDNTTLLVHKDTTDAIDLAYTISYFKTNATTESATNSNVAGIIQGSEVAIGPETSVVVTVNDKPVSPKPTTTNTVTTPKPSLPAITPKPEITYTYALPVSDPKGFTDLKVGYLGIGTTNTQGNFISTGSLKKDVAGAIQFTVHNVGTKTSGDWTFTTLLPGDINYTSKTQTQLKPNEKTTLTISFPAVSELDLQKFIFEVTTKDDKTESNNKITWSTIVLK